MKDALQQGDGISGRHATARHMAERAVAAEARGDQDEADRLFAEAEKLDPEAVANVLSESVTSRASDPGEQNDAEVAGMSRTVEPHSDAPSRAGITGPGSGADAQGS